MLLKVAIPVLVMAVAFDCDPGHRIFLGAGIESIQVQMRPEVSKRHIFELPSEGW